MVLLSVQFCIPFSESKQCSHLDGLQEGGKHKKAYDDLPGSMQMLHKIPAYKGNKQNSNQNIIHLRMFHKNTEIK